MRVCITLDDLPLWLDGDELDGLLVILPPRLYGVIHAMYGPHPRTMRQLSVEMGISYGRVQQLHQSALRMIRCGYRSLHPKPATVHRVTVPLEQDDNDDFVAEDFDIGDD